jgi:phospholipase C
MLLPMTLVVARAQFAEAADPDTSSAAQVLADGPCDQTAPAAAHYRHVIWIWMENHSYGQVIGSADAPFENAIAHACGLATNYRAITHPTLPNYLAATAGSTFGVTSDHRALRRVIRAPNLFDEVTASGRQWRIYSESMPSNCHRMGKYGFARNPAVWFRDDRRRCARWDVPMGTADHGPLTHALDANRLPTFSLMVPDLCHATHGCPVSTGDAWLSTWIHRIVSSPAYRDHRTVVFLTWDEGKHDLGQHIPMIVISPSTAAGTMSGSAFNHYSLLQTTAGLLGVPAPGRAAEAPPMKAAFGL